MKIKFTTEELKGFVAQPEDSCPHFNDIIQNIQRMINNVDVNLEDNIIESLNKGFKIIERIDGWSNGWKDSFDEISIDDVVTEAYVSAANEELQKNEKINIDEIKEKFLDVLTNDFTGQISDLSFNNPDIELTEAELNIDRLFINMKKVELNEYIEEMRTFASTKRAYTNYMKDAYKNHSLINDKNDIIQPSEIISEQIKPNDNIYNLGVLFSEQSINKLIKDDVISEIDSFLIEKMNNKDKKDLILESLDKNGFKKVSYYKDLRDFQEGKGYKTEKTEAKSKIKIKQKNQ